MSVLPSMQLAASSATDCAAGDTVGGMAGEVTTFNSSNGQGLALGRGNNDNRGQGEGKGLGLGRGNNDKRGNNEVVFDMDLKDEFVESSELSAASSCMVSAQGGTAARRGGPLFGSYT